MASNNELDQAFQELEADFGYAKEVRRELIDNLRVQAAKIKISEYDKPMMITAKMTVVKTLDDMLKSDSSLTLDKLKMKLARKDSETNGAIGATIAAMLKSMRINEDVGGGSTPKDPTEGAMDAITERAEQISKEGDAKTKKALIITDGETTECNGLPSSEVPVTKLKPLKEDDEEL